MRTFKQSRSYFRLPATFLLAVLLLLSVPFGVRADEDEQRSFSEGLWQNGFYESTLGDMAGRRLYVYGIADIVFGIHGYVKKTQGIPENEMRHARKILTQLIQRGLIK